MPKIGMRIIKSSVAVFFCFLIYMIRGDGIPFYSAIAAVLCMQPYVSHSWRVALNRTVGSLIGGTAGMLVMLMEKEFIPAQYPLLKYLLISAVIIPLIYSTVLLKKPSAAYIACVVFMSITVSHGLDANPYSFAFNRILDTLIGIFVSLGVNAFHLPKHKNLRLLFVSDLDGTLTGSNGKISNYTRIKLNQLIQEGAAVTVASGHSAASVAPILSGIHLNIPIITLNGAALYDLNAKTYLSCKTIPYDDAAEILDVFQKHGKNCFTHTVVHDTLHIYYGDFTNPAEEKLLEENKRKPLKNYIYCPLPENRDVVYFRAVDTPDTVKALISGILQLKCRDKIHIAYEPDQSSKGYDILDIYSSAATKATAMFELSKLLSAERTAAFGDADSDIAMLEDADYGYAVANATENLKEAAPAIIGSCDSDAVIKMMEKLFHSKRLL